MKKNLSLTGVLALSVLGASGCLSTQNQSQIDGNASAASPVVEAYFEYPGPMEKWAGPATWMMHVRLKDQGAPEVKVTPEFARFVPKPVETAPQAPTPDAKTQDGSIAPRVPASTLAIASQKELLVPVKELPSEAARDILNHLSTAVNTPPPAFTGCMYPVRVRLVRASGALVEKVSCRSDVGWPRAVSEAVNAFLSGSVKPAAVKPVLPEKQDAAVAAQGTTAPAESDRSPASE
jgi:hypothetical protein